MTTRPILTLRQLALRSPLTPLLIALVFVLTSDSLHAQFPRLARQPFRPLVPERAPAPAIAQPPAQPSMFRTETPHFIVTAPDQQLAAKVAIEAERFRSELAILWLGQELPEWRDKCPIAVELNRNAGGETSFAFVTDGSGGGQPISWEMKIFGPPDRLLDAVLPHEITHTIFATHFGRPLPRWADEGACTTVEHESERSKNHRMLIDFLTASPSRGIPFNRMFTMKDYPHDILPLYAQGYSLSKFLIQQKGRRHFLNYIGAGMVAEEQGHPLRQWDQTTAKFYGYKDLSDLQIAWQDWVRKGSPDQATQSIAANVQAPTPAVAPASATLSASNVAAAVNPIPASPVADNLRRNTVVSLNSDAEKSGSWYVRQSRAEDNRVETNRKSLADDKEKTIRR